MIEAILGRLAAGDNLGLEEMAATIDAVVGLELEGQRAVARVYLTAEQPDARVVLLAGESILVDERFDGSPQQHQEFVAVVPHGADETDLELSVYGASGRMLVSYKPGQDEIDIVRLSDVTVVVLVPGMGDDVQSLKAGIMEIADLFVVNKADREGADRVEKEVRAMQSLATSHGDWVPPVVKTVASSGEGIDKLIDAIAQMKQWLETDGRKESRRRRYWRERIVEMMRHALMRQMREQGLSDAELDAHAARVANGEEDPYRLVPELVARVVKA